MMNILKILIVIVSIILVVSGFKKDKVKLKEVGLAKPDPMSRTLLKKCKVYAAKS